MGWRDGTEASEDLEGQWWAGVRAPQRAASSGAGFGGLVSSHQTPKIHLSSRPFEVQRAFAEP